jgi:ribose/xylose/arabinose/galactoside ABC-type transport system permease subunit
MVTSTPKSKGLLPKKALASNPIRGGFRDLTSWALPASLIVMFGVFSILTPSTFLGSQNLENMLDQAVVPVCLACGITLVLAVGEFDLSFTATLGFASGLVIDLMSSNGFSWPVAVLVTFLAALVVGVIVGLLVTFGRSSSFIVTLAVGSALTGIELAITNNQPIYSGVPSGYGDFATNEILGLHQPVWIGILVVALLFTLLHRTRFGRHAQSIGGNPTAAYFAGVRVRQIKIACFTITAILAALAAVILTSRASSYFPNSAGNFLLTTYAAVFLGAASSRTGGFTIIGSTLGAIWLIVLQTGLTLNNAPTWSTYLIQGVVLAFAVIIGSSARSRS